MGLRFAHTADWRLGWEYEAEFSLTAGTAPWRVEAVSRLLSLAFEQGAQFVLVAGNVFASENPAPQWVSAFLEVLAASPLPIVIIPGQLDPPVPGSAWLSSQLQQAIGELSHVHLFLEPGQCRVVEGVQVWACPPNWLQPELDPTQWLQEAGEEGTYKVALAHGPLRTQSASIIDAARPDFNWRYAIEPFRAERTALDYLALGGPMPTPAPGPGRATAPAGPRCWSSPGPECAGYGDGHGGEALLVDLPSPGGQPVVHSFSTSAIHRLDLGPVRLQGSADVDLFELKLRDVDPGQNFVVRGQLEGNLRPVDFERLVAVLHNLRQRVAVADLNCEAVQLSPGPADWEALSLDLVEQGALQRLMSREDSDENAPQVACALLFQLLSKEPV